VRGRRKHAEEHENHERWLISYADFITLLFTFFVALYALSAMDKGKMEQFSGSLRESFKIIDNPIPLIENKGKSIAEDLNKVVAGVQGISVKNDLRGVVVTFSDGMLFASGAVDIKRDAYESLEKLSKVVNNAPGRITIEGHTDNVPVTGGKYASNWEISTGRAASVLSFFVEKGLDPNRFSIAGYAEYRPIISNDTEEGRARNRRVEMVISK
jgi:chemotaxis protein MotB